MSAENMPMSVPAVRARPLLLRHLPYFAGAAVLVTLTATMQFDGYIHNILMQAVTFAIAVFGLSVVLGLCGQINLAQAAFFGLGAYAVGIGTSDYHVSYWFWPARCWALRRCGSAGITSRWSRSRSSRSSPW
jgi:branched-chain amino acid transport system permease protein